MLRDEVDYTSKYGDEPGTRFACCSALADAAPAAAADDGAGLSAASLYWLTFAQVRARRSLLRRRAQRSEGAFWRAFCALC